MSGKWSFQGGLCRGHTIGAPQAAAPKTAAAAAAAAAAARAFRSRERDAGVGVAVDNESGPRREVTAHLRIKLPAIGCR